MTVVSAPVPARPDSSLAIPAGGGLGVALLVIGLWAASTGWLVASDLGAWNPLQQAIALGWQTFLFAGLFITAHDAMHGAVCLGDLQLNHAIGRIAAWFYALFDYSELHRKHWQHHNYPASDRDPDFHAPRWRQFWFWYVRFMGGYWSWLRIGALAGIYNLLAYLVGIPNENLMLFWVAPSLLSSLQLFFFGTFLPHRRPAGGYVNAYRARTQAWPWLLSALACYNFGYHEEHHRFPHLSWWQLPQAYRLRQAQLAVEGEQPSSAFPH